MKLNRNIKAFQIKPFSPKQKKLLFWWEKGSPYSKYDIVIADGAIRSGKTIAMICGFLRWSQKTFQGETFILAGKSMGALKRNVVKPILQILMAWGWDYEYNRSENYLIIGSNIYYCFGANNEASQDVLQGLTAAGALADEVALFPESFVEQMVSRCSVEGSKIWMNCNPESPYHYIKVEYIDKAKEKKIFYLHFELDDNLTLSGMIKERYRRLFFGLWFKRMILGLWVMAEGVIYDMFDDKVHVIDVLREKKDEFGRPVTDVKRIFEKLYLGVDYATGNPTAFILAGLFNNSVYVVDEYYWDSKKMEKQKTDAEYSKDLRDFIKGREPNSILIDPSAASFILQLQRDGVKNIEDAENDVLDGIRNVGTLFCNQKLFIFRKCANLLKEITTYIWDTKAQEKGEDKPVKQNDHALDALRYVVRTKLKYLVPGPLPQYKPVERKVNQRTGY